MLKIFFRSFIFFFFFTLHFLFFFLLGFLAFRARFGISIFSRTEDRTIDRSALVKRSNARVLAHRSGNRSRWGLDECREFSPNLTRTLITDFSRTWVFRYTWVIVFFFFLCFSILIRRYTVAPRKRSSYRFASSFVYQAEETISLDRYSNDLVSRANERKIMPSILSFSFSLSLSLSLPLNATVHGKSSVFTLKFLYKIFACMRAYWKYR